MKISKLSYIKPLTKTVYSYRIELLFSFIFVLILTLGYLLSTYPTLDITFVNTGVLLATLSGSIIIWCVIFLGLLVLKQRVVSRRISSGVVLLKNLSDNKLWAFTSLIIFICYIPILLASLSMLSPDSWNSIRQAVGIAPLNNSNPLIFTAFVSIFINIGRSIGGIEFGTVLFSFVQSAILAIIFAKIIVWMRNENVSKAGITATFIFYAILPINSVAGLIMWKDILFAGFGLMFLLLLRQLYFEKDKFFTVKKIASFILFAFLFCTWRNNGIFAYELFLILAVIIDRKLLFKSKFLLLLIAPIVLSFIYLQVIKLPTSQAVKISVPLQQIARTVKYEGSSISDNDREIINEALPYDQLDEKYNPSLSDPVMSSLNEPAFEKNEGRYFDMWLRLLGSHTKTFIAAFAYNNYGYIYPLYKSPTPTDILLNNANHPNAISGYTDTAYSNGGKFVTIEYRNVVMKPIEIFHNVGFYTSIIILCAYIAVIRRKRELNGVFIILFSLFITTILGPVNGEFRYLYLFVVAAPFIIASVFSDQTTKKVKARRG